MTDHPEKQDPRSRLWLASIGQKPGEKSRASKYDPSNCEKVIFWASEGEFIEQWAARLDVSISTIYHWANRHPDFAEAVRIAYAKMADFWLRVGVSNLGNPNFRSPVYLEILRKRLPALWKHEPLEPPSVNPTAVGNSDDQAAPVAFSQDERRRMSSEELKAAIEQFQRRRAHDGTRD